jgi:hypothetical protein
MEVVSRIIRSRMRSGTDPHPSLGGKRARNTRCAGPLSGKGNITHSERSWNCTFYDLSHRPERITSMVLSGRDLFPTVKSAAV